MLIILVVDSFEIIMMLQYDHNDLCLLNRVHTFHSTNWLHIDVIFSYEWHFCFPSPSLTLSFYIFLTQPRTILKHIYCITPNGIGSFAIQIPEILALFRRCCYFLYMEYEQLPCASIISIYFGKCEILPSYIHRVQNGEKKLAHTTKLDDI